EDRRNTIRTLQERQDQNRQSQAFKGLIALPFATQIISSMLEKSEATGEKKDTNSIISASTQGLGLGGTLGLLVGGKKGIGLTAVTTAFFALKSVSENLGTSFAQLSSQAEHMQVSNNRIIESAT